MAGDELILDLEKLRVETITGRVLVDDVDVTLKRGEILGLIGESGAGKSTIGLASMAYARAGMRITGGTITLAGTELRASTAAAPPPHARQEHRLYRAERRGLVQPEHDADGPGLRSAGHARRHVTQPKPRPTPGSCSASCNCPIPTRSASATRTRSRAASCSASWPPWR